jgi:hypothetical protein
VVQHFTNHTLVWHFTFPLDRLPRSTYLLCRRDAASPKHLTKVDAFVRRCQAEPDQMQRSHVIGLFQPILPPTPVTAFPLPLRGGLLAAHRDGWILAGFSVLKYREPSDRVAPRLAHPLTSVSGRTGD